MKFSIKNCLIAFKNLIKSINCCNSKCLNQSVNVLDDDIINKLNSLQEQLEEAWQHIHDLRSVSHRVSYI
jgi:hypothetical protein